MAIMKIKDCDFEYKKSMECIREVLKRTRRKLSDGEMYSAWKDNIACYLMDNAEMSHVESNFIARGLLDYLFQLGEYEEHIDDRSEKIEE
jgi:hypothetical protein